MSTSAISDPHSFWLQARSQGVCTICRRGGDFSAHHVVFRRWLKKNHKPLHDPRNARRLCPSCNLNFEARSIEFPLERLLDVNIDYAFEVMDAYAYDWLRQNYSGDDPRLDVMLNVVSG